MTSDPIESFSGPGAEFPAVVGLPKSSDVFHGFTSDDVFLHIGACQEKGASSANGRGSPGYETSAVDNDGYNGVHVTMTNQSIFQLPWIHSRVAVKSLIMHVLYNSCHKCKSLRFLHFSGSKAAFLEQCLEKRIGLMNCFHVHL